MHRKLSIKQQSVYNDCIHDYVELSPLCLAYVASVEFRRLGSIKQLGTTGLVYPANHTRGEHSLGVMHLAKVVATKLNIPERECDLISLAGLMHDIGHLPYSHLFDELLERMSETEELTVPIKHEHRSIEIFRKLSKRIGLLTEKEVEFVIACIMGYTFDSYPKYYFQIVNGTVDVDKLDYLQRDAYYTSLGEVKQSYIIRNIVVNSNGELAFQEKARHNIQLLLDLRKSMHIRVYQHPRALYYDSLYLCMMKRVWDELKERLDDLWENDVETLLRTHPKTRDMYLRMLQEYIPQEEYENESPVLEYADPKPCYIEDVKFVDE